MNELLKENKTIKPSKLKPEIFYQDDETFEEKIQTFIKHIEIHIDRVTHTLIFDNTFNNLPIAILIVRPTTQRYYFTLVTCGLSTKPMQNVDPTNPDMFCELLMSLPADWPFPENEEDFFTLQSKDRMPIELLLQLSSHGLHSQSLWIGNTITGNKINPDFPNIKSYLLDLPYSLDPEARFAIFPNKKLTQSIFFLGVYPLLSDEYEYKLKEGAEKLFDKMIEKNVTVVFEPTRKSIFKK